MTKATVGSGAPLDQGMVALLRGSPGCRVFLEIPDPKAQLAPLGRKGKRGTVRTEGQASPDSPEPRVSRACGDLVETSAPRVTGA